MKIAHDFITFKIFPNLGRANDTFLLGFALKVKHNDPLRKDCGVEKIHRFCEWKECKTEQEILSFIRITIPRLMEQLKLVIEKKIARVNEVDNNLIDFPFTEYSIERL